MEPSSTDLFWEDRARLLRVMAHPVRLRILNALREQPRCVKDINSLISLVQPHLSQHIAALRKANLIDCHVSGSLRCYYIVQPRLVKKMLQLLIEDHPIRQRSCDSVIRASQQGKKSPTDRKIENDE